MTPRKHGNKWKLTFRDEGKLVNKSFDTETAAQQFCLMLDSAKQSKLTSKSHVQTVTVEDMDLIDKYIAFNFSGKRPLTIRNIRTILGKVSKEIGLGALTTVALFELLQRYKSSTARGFIKWVKHYCGWYNDIIDKDKEFDINYSALTKTLNRNDKKTKPYLSEDDFRKLILSLKNKRHVAVYKLMASSGIRIRELTRLDGEDFHADSWHITIPAGKTKANKERSFIVPVELRNDIKPFLSTEPKAPLLSHKGKRCSPESMGGIFADQCKKAGLGKRNIHLLRSFAIKKILEASAGDYEVVRKICGWDSAEMQKYLDNMNSKKEEVANFLSFSDDVVEVSREMDGIVSRIKEYMEKQKLDAKRLAAKSKVSYQFVNALLEKKQSPEIEALLKIAVALECSVNFDTVDFNQW